MINKTPKQDSMISLLLSVFNSIQDGVSVHDKEFNILLVNKAMNRIYSHHVPLEGKKCYEVFHNRTEHCEVCPAVESLKSGKPGKTEIPLIVNNHVKGTLELFTFPMTDESGNPSGIVGFKKDITERKRMEEALKVNEESYQALLDAIPDLMFTFDKEGVFIDFNYHTSDNLLMMPEDFLNKKITDVLPPILSKQTIESLKRLFETGKMQSFEYMLEIRGASEYFECRLVLCGEDKALAIVRNITGRKKAEKDLRDSGDRILRQKAAITKLILDETLVNEDFYSVLNKINEVLARTISVERSSVWLINEEKTEMQCLALYDAMEKEHSKGYILKLTDYPAYFEAIFSDGRISVENAQSDPRTSELTENYLLPSNIQSMLDAAIVIEGELTGVVCLETVRDKREWCTDEETFVSTAASIIAQLLTNRQRKQAEESLSETKEELEQFFSSSLDLLSIIGINGDFIRFNPEWEKVFGYSHKELESANFLDYVHPEDLDAAQKVLNDLKNQEEVLSFENRYRCQDGSYRWIEWSAKPKGDLIYAAARDISDRIIARTALSNQLEIERLISEVSSTFANLPTEKVDEGIKKITGLIGEFFEADHSYVFQRRKSFTMNSKKEQPDLPADGSFVEDASEWCRSGIVSQLNSLRNVQLQQCPWFFKKLLSFETMVVNSVNELPPEAAAEKSSLQLLSIKSMILVPIVSSNKILGYIVLDTVEQEKKWQEDRISLLKVIAEIIAGAMEKLYTEKLLQFERAQVLSIFDSINEIIYVADPETHRILYINQAMRDNFTYNPLGGLCYQELQNRDTICEFCTNDIIMKDKGKPYQWEYYNPSVDRTFLITDKIITWPDGRDVRFELAVDITARKKGEEEREILQANLYQAQKMESVGRLAGGIAHDFNNMLAVILGYTELALHQTKPGQSLNNLLMEIRKATQQSALLTKQLLAFAHKQTIDPLIMNLNAVIEDTLKMLIRIIGEDIDLKLVPGDNLWLIMMDNSQINQMLTNLCVNSRDAITGKEGKIVIMTENVILDEQYRSKNPDFLPGEYVKLTVSDNGCGIDNESLDKLFDPFYTTKGIGKGTGLGLATVYGIMKQNNGFIELTSEKGEGSAFHLYFPRHKTEGETVVKKETIDSPVQGSETILFVEDEQSANEIIATILEKFGYRVLSATLPSEALRLAEKHDGEIHLLFSDIVMPEMNGQQLAAKLLKKYPGLKLLFTSGYQTDMKNEEGEVDTEFFFIKKPFSMKDLAVKVREVLDD